MSWTPNRFCRECGDPKRLHTPKGLCRYEVKSGWSDAQESLSPMNYLVMVRRGVQVFPAKRVEQWDHNGKNWGWVYPRRRDDGELENVSVIGISHWRSILRKEDKEVPRDRDRGIFSNP